MSAAAPQRVWVDGLETRELPVTDRGLHYGDGLFETIACERHAPRFLDWHLERLVAGAGRLGIALPAKALLERELRAAAAAGPATSLLKLIVTRGDAVERGYAPAAGAAPRRVLLRYGWDGRRNATPVRVRMARLRLGENPQLAGIKHLNRLEQVLARAEWDDPGIVEGLLCSSGGRLACGTASNLFLVVEGRLVTPRLDRCGVAGIMRRVVLEEALQLGLDPVESELWPTDLERASEIFITNVRLGIAPVGELDGRAVPAAPGPLTQALLASLGRRWACEPVA